MQSFVLCGCQGRFRWAIVRQRWAEFRLHGGFFETEFWIARIGRCHDADLCHAILGASLEHSANRGTCYCNSIFSAACSGPRSTRKSLQRAGQGKHASDHRPLFPHPKSNLRLWQPGGRWIHSLGRSALVVVVLRCFDPFAGLSKQKRGAGAGREIRRILSGVQATDVVLIR